MSKKKNNMLNASLAAMFGLLATVDGANDFAPKLRVHTMPKEPTAHEIEIEIKCENDRIAKAEARRARRAAKLERNNKQCEDK